MGNSYDSLMQVKGVPALKELVARWDKLSENVTKTRAERINILPDLLWISDEGINKTELLTLLSDFLVEKGNLTSFSSDTKFIEFSFVYSADPSDYSELSRLNLRINSVKGYRNSFEGVVYVDISGWVDRLDDERFLTFLEYLAANSASWLIILNADRSALSDVSRLESVLSTYLRIEKLQMEMPSTRDLFELAQDILSSYDFRLDDGAKKLVRKSIDVMRKSKKFDGYQTIRYLCSDIIYVSLARKAKDLFCLTAADLEAFSADGEYVKHILESSEKRALGKIGFDGGSDDDR